MTIDEGDIAAQQPMLDVLDEVETPFAIIRSSAFIDRPATILLEGVLPNGGAIYHLLARLGQQRCYATATKQATRTPKRCPCDGRDKIERRSMNNRKLLIVFSPGDQ